jgi:hypothetical protein
VRSDPCGDGNSELHGGDSDATDADDHSGKPDNRFWSRTLAGYL